MPVAFLEFVSVNVELYLAKCFLADENVLASPLLHSKAHQQRRKYPKFIHHQVDETELQNQSLTQKKEAMVKTKAEGDSEGDLEVAEGDEVVAVVEAEDTVDFSIDKREEKAKILSQSPWIQRKEKFRDGQNLKFYTQVVNRMQPKF